jgi:hypothetical protein
LPWSAIDGFLDALFSGDPAKVDQVLAPEFQILRSDGTSYDKVSYVGALPKHKVRATKTNLAAYLPFSLAGSKMRSVIPA